MVLRILSLEDRIVYDGAVAHAVVASAPPAGDAASAPSHSSSAVVDHSPPNVLVVSEGVPAESLLLNAAKSNTKIVQYDPNAMSLAQLNAAINQALNGQKAGYIGFVSEGAQGSIQLLANKSMTADTIKAAAENQDVLNFWHNIAGNILPNGSIDLFGSNIAKGSEGRQLITQLQSLIASDGVSVEIHASTDLTGGHAVGGNWLLESGTNGTPSVNEAGIYFDMNALSGWNGLLNQSLEIRTTNSLVTTNSGGSSTFTATLSSQPSDPVTIPLTVSDPANVHLSVDSLTFTRDNWNIPQTVTISGINDGVFSGKTISSLTINDGSASIPMVVNGLPSHGLDVINVDNLNTPSTHTELLVIPSNLPDLSLFLAGLNQDTRVVVYNPSTSTLDSLQNDINAALAGAKAYSIGFANEGNAGHFNLLTNQTVDINTIQNASMVSFWQGVASHIADGGYLDLLACNLASNADGLAVVSTLQQLLSANSHIVHVDASTDLTGNPSYGGNWIMEVGAAGSRDVQPVYFDQQISGWYDTFVIDRAFTARYSTNTTGNITFAANTVLKGTTAISDNHDVTMTYVDADSNVNTFNSSSSVLTIPTGAQVLFAGLYWGGEVSGDALTSAPTPSSKNTVLLVTPTNSTYTTITASQVDTDTTVTSGVNTSNYSAFADVTSIVQGAGAGSYRVANVQIATGLQSGGHGAEGGWSLIVVYQDATQPMRNLVVFDGYAFINTSGSATVNLSGFQTPVTGTVDTKVGVVAQEGDQFLTGDSFTLNGSQVSDALNPANNFFNGKMTNLGALVTGNTPNDAGQNWGYDTKIVDATGKLTNNQTSTTATFQTSTDVYYLSVFTFATTLNTPNLTLTKSVADLTHSGGPFRPGDTLQYTLVATNTGTDAANNVVLTDVIPTGLTYLANSLSITSGANAGAKTDATGDDQGYFSGNTVTFDLGTGATALLGGSLAAGASTTITFSATINSVTDGTIITNQGSISGVGASLGLAANATSNQVSVAVDNQSLSIGNASVTEGNSGTTTMTFTVSLNRASTQTVTVNYATADGTATTADSDYLAASGTLTFAPGQTSKTVTVTVNGDTKFEPDETLLVNLSSAVNAVISTGTGTGTILNDDSQPAISINNVSQNEGNSGTTAFTFTVSLSSASTQAVTVNYATADGTATVTDGDYTAASGTLTFAAGVTSQTVTVNVNGDTKFEPTETFTVGLTAPTNATIASGTGTGTIVNDDTQPTISINNVSHNEGNSGTTAYTFTVSLSNASSQAITVNYATADGTATVIDGDYTAASGTLTFAAGVTSQTVTVNVNGDTKFEPTETFTVGLTAPTNATIAAATGTGTITNDDTQPTISISNVSQNEGNSGTTVFNFTVSLSNASSQAITVHYATADGTATVADNDYTAASGTLTFAAGVTSQTVTVNVTGDTKFEATQAFTVGLTAPTNATIATATGTGTIVNDDTQPTISINNISQNEGNSGITNFIFTVSLSNASDQNINVSYITVDGTALSTDDFGFASSGVSFAPGVTSQTISISVVGDTKFEANETFSVNLSGATNATIATATGTATIVNDDAQPTISINNVSQNEGNSGTTAFTFTVSLSNASSQVVGVTYTTSGGSASVADGDFTAASGVLTFAAGQLTRTVTVNVNGDTKFEPNETFFVNLSSPINSTIASGTGTGTIVNDDTQPAISINNVSLNEGNSGTTAFTFTVSLSNASSFPVTVNYATADGTATIAGSDYTAATGTLTFAAGVTSQTVTVNVNGDTTFESNETFTVGLTGATNATIANATGTGTIVNDDAGPTISINNVSQSEGNSGTTVYTFTVSLSAASSLVTTVNYATADGSATVADGDYTATSGTLTFAAGVTSQTVTVNVNGDTKFEPNETFTVGLTAPTNATIATGTGIGTIVNDDTQPTISINNVSQNEGNSGTTAYTFTVSLSNASSQAITVNYATADGTAAAADGDFAAATGTLTFAAGVTSQTVTVNVNGDTKFESDETFTVGLTAPTNATIDVGTGTGTIVNDDTQPTISINNVSQNEGNSGTTAYTFTVSLSNASSQAITVNYATADGTATLVDNDYAAASGTLTFAAGVTSQTITVNVNGDTNFEPNETFTVGLSAPTNATIAVGTGTGTIVNDDTQPTISINNVSQNEGNSGTTAYTFTVSLSNASTQAITVNYATADGTATVADGDYAAATGTLTFAAGVTSQTVTVNVNGDTKFEPNETFTVGLTAPTNATIAAATGTGTIVNDDTQPTISINNVSQNEGNSGTTAYTFTVSLSNASTQTITVHYAAADGTATVVDGDYAATSGTLTFAAGVTSQTVTVNVNGDTKFEANETFTVGLTTPTNATIASGTGTGTIVNDDTQPAISISNVSQNEGNSGTTAFVFTVSLSNASSQAITVNYATADGTATIVDGDYNAASGVLTFAAGTTTQTITVNVNGDTKFEPTETFTVGLASPTNAVIASGTGTGTIVNDDSQPVISINSISQAEGDSGITNATFTVSLSNASSSVVTVDFATADGTALLSDSDYVQTNGTLTFNPGETTKTITVGIVGDTTPETNETFLVNLTNAVNGSIGTNPGVGTIVNDDGAVTLSVSDVSIVEGDSGTSVLTFVVTRTGSTLSDVTFDYATADNTALTSDGDYAAASGSGTILAGGSSATTTISVTINGDTKFEPNESFFVNLTNVLNANVVKSQGVGTILNDDAAPVAAIDAGSLSVSHPEGNSGTTAYDFMVSLDRVSSQDTIVHYSTQDGTATSASGDYQGITNGQLTILAGQTSGTVTVLVNGDVTFEPDETFLVNLTSVDNGTLGASNIQATGTIVNDDAVPAATIDTGSLSVSHLEGDSGTTAYNFTVNLSNPSTQDVTVHYSTQDGTATAASGDYQAVTDGQLTILAGQTTGTITILVNGDVTFEPDETFLVNLTSVDNGTVGASNVQAAGTIQNDDTAPAATIDTGSLSVSHVEGNSGTTAYNFTVNLSNPSTQDVTVHYSTQDGTATSASGDYQAVTDGQLTILAGQTTGTITILVNGDITFEPNETFLLNLTSVDNGTLGASNIQAAGTIVNDDAVPAATIDAGSLSVSHLEGDSGTTAYNFTVNLSNPSTQDVTVHYSTQDGTATVANGDYQPITNGQLTILAGQTTGTITVLVNGDTTFEPNETFLLNLTSVDNGTLGASNVQATGTIVNDDAASAVTIDAGSLSVSHLEGNSGTTAYNFTVNLSNPSTQDITVHYSTQDGTAIAASGDYQAITDGQLTILAGQTSGTITVLVNGDVTFEPNETFLVNLTSVDNGILGASDIQAAGTIVNDDAAPTASIDSGSLSVSHLEGNSGTTAYNFTVNLSNPSTQDVTVHYSTQDGTATAASGDYQAVTDGQLTILAGQTSGTITVLVNGDVTFEPDETFLLNLTSVDNGSLAASNVQAAGTILNDDTAPVATVDFGSLSVSHLEGNSGTTAYSFTVNLSNPSAQDVTVHYSTQDGTATAANGDYQPVTDGQLTILAGQTSGTITILVNGDVTFEPDETFLVNLTSVDNGALGASDTQAAGTIVNDDTAPAASIDAGSLSVSHLEGNSGTTAYSFTVNLTNPSSEDVVVHYSTQDGTATAASGDYQAITDGQLTILAGQTSGTITVLVNGDTTFEPNETFLVNLTSVDGGTVGASDNQAAGTILNDDTAPVVTIDSGSLSVSHLEGSSGTTAYNFTVNLSNPSAQDVTVHYSTQDGTATVVNGDYQQITDGQLTILAGQTSGTITVLVNGDTTFEPDEAFLVNLTSVDNGTLGASDIQASGTILNDDSAPAASIDSGSLSVSHLEGDSGTTAYNFTVNLTNPSSQDVVVHYSTQDGTATSASGDYQPVTDGQLTILAGQTSGTITVLVNGDITFEPDEAFSVILTSVDNGVLAGSDVQAAGTILNDDAAPAVSIDAGSLSVSHLEGNSGTTAYNFTVNLTNPSAQDVVVHYSTQDGTATAASGDYQGVTDGQLTILAGQTSGTITVLVNGDTTFESDENFLVNLTSVDNGTLSASNTQAAGTILNDDTAPVVSIDPGSLNIAHLEGNSGTRQYDFTVNLSNPSSQDIVVHYSTQDGTATAASGDYQGVTNGQLTILAGQTSGTITVLVNGDTTFEPNETFLVNLTSVDGGTVGTSNNQAAGTILNDDTAPVVTLDSGSLSVSHLEGNSGTTAYNFTVNLSNTSAQDVIVHYSTQDGTASIANGDYQQITDGQLTILAGQTSGTITVLVNGDTTFEPDENFLVTLTGVDNGTLGASNIQATGTILNDDSVPAASIDSGSLSVSHLEGDSGTTAYNFTVNLTNASTQDVVVHYSTQDGTATSASGDYQPVTDGQLTILAGQTSGTITVLVNGDITFEPDEAFSVILTSVDNGVLGGSNVQAGGTILNDDTAPAASIDAGSLSVSHLEGNSGTTAYNFTVNLTNPSAQDVVVHYSTQDGTATAVSGDYQGVTDGQLTILAGQTSGTITVLVNGDTTFESDENFLVNLISVDNGTLSGSNTQAAGTILNDDAAPAASIDPGSLSVSHLEGNSGTTAYNFTVNLSNPSSQDVIIHYSTQDGTATAVSGDYQGVTDGQLTILAGQTSGTITILVNGDTTFEPNENFLVNLTSVDNGTLSSSNTQAAGTILNDDAAPAASIDPGSLSVSHLEGNSGTTAYNFTVNLSNASSQDVIVHYGTQDGTATAGSGDYQGITDGQLTILAGQTTGTITVLVNGDTTFEPNETFLVNLTGVDNGTLAGSNVQAAGTIQNDDAAPVVTIDPNSSIVSHLEGNSGTTAYTFTVNLTNPSTQDVIVHYSTQDGTATSASGDYQSVTDGQLVILAGQTSGTITVLSKGDVTFEPDEAFTVKLTSVDNGTLGTSDTQGSAVILNDDSAPTASIGSGTVIGNGSPAQVETLVVSLTNPSYQTVTIDWATADHTATAANNDYVAASGVLVFAPNETSKTIEVIVNGNIHSNDTRDFFVNLFNADNTVVTQPQGIVTVISNNPSTPVPATPPLPPPAEPPAADQVFVSNDAAYTPAPITFPTTPVSFIGNTPQLHLPEILPEILVTQVHQKQDVIGASDSIEEQILKLREKAGMYQVEGAFNIYLTDRPIAPVVIHLTTENIPQDSVSPLTVTFTPDNWNVPQEINVKVPNSIDLKGSEVIHIITEPATSEDPHYNGYDPADINILVPKKNDLSHKDTTPVNGKNNEVSNTDNKSTDQTDAELKSKEHKPDKKMAA